MSTVNSEFGVFNITKNNTEFEVDGPDNFFATFSYSRRNLYDANNNVIGETVDSDYEYGTAFANAANAVFAKIRELSEKQEREQLIAINGTLSNIYNKLVEMQDTQVVISKDLQDIRDRASNESLGVVIHSKPTVGNAHSLSRAMTVNALRTSNMLEDVKREMINPTELPYDDFNTKGDTSFSSGSVEHYDTYTNNNTSG